MLFSSVTGEADKMERVLYLVKRYGTAVVAMCMDGRHSEMVLVRGLP